MPNEHRIKTVVDIGAQIQGFERGVSQMKSALSQVQLSDNMDKDLKEMFANATRQIETMKKQVENNPLELVDIKQLRSDLGELEKIYKRLGVKFESAQFSGGDSKKEAKAIEALIKTRKNYNESIKDSEKALSQENKTLEKLKDNLATYEAINNAVKQTKENAVKEQQAANKAYDDEANNVKQLKEDLDKLIATRKEHENSQKGKRFNATKQSREDDAKIAEAQEKYNAAVERQIQLQEAAARAAEKVKTATDAADDAEKKYSKNINEANAQIKGHEERVKELETALKEKVAGALEEVRNSLKESDIAWEEFGIEPDKIQNINDLENALSKLEDASSQKVTLTLDQLRAILQQVAEEARHAEKELDNAEEGIHELSDTEKEIRQLSERLKQFFSIGSAVQLFRKALRSAYETIKDLDAVMTETAVVTDFTVGDMWSQLPEYTQRANELGISIHSAYEAATIYYQQGLKTNEVMAVSNETLKMARIAGLDAATATDRMTNALRGFNMEINENNAQRIADVYSKLAAMSASNVDEISTAMTKVASLASSANMQFETTAAFLSQIIETTRESAETAGTALKTIVARFSEVKELYSQGELLGTDEEGEAIDVNKVGKALRTAGIDLNEFLTGSKGLDEILLDLASKWDSLDIVQQRYIATMAAGSRQQSRFIAMMQDYKRTTELVTAANDANGASQQQYNKTLESLDVKLTRLKNAWAEFTMSIMNSDVVKFLVDAATAIVQVINKLTDSLPAVTSGLAKLGVVASGLFAGRKLTGAIFGKGASLLTTLLGTDKKAAQSTINQTKGVVTSALKDILSEQTVGKTLLGGITEQFNKNNNATLAKIFGFLGNGKGWFKNIGQNVGMWMGEGINKAGPFIGKILSGILSPTGLAIAAGAVIGGLLIKGIVNVIHDNSLEGQIERINKRTEALQQSASQAAEAYQSINEYISQHDEAIKAINGLKKGTEEWYAAIKEANVQTQELVDKYGLLSSYDVKVDPTTGLIYIDKNKLEEAEKAYAKQEKTQQVAAAMSAEEGRRKELIAGGEGLVVGYDQAQRDYIDDITKSLGIAFSDFEEAVAQGTINLKGNELFNEKEIKQIKKLGEYGLERQTELQKIEAYNQNLANTIISSLELPDSEKQTISNFLSNQISDIEKQAVKAATEDFNDEDFEFDRSAFLKQNPYLKNLFEYKNGEFFKKGTDEVVEDDAIIQELAAYYVTQFSEKFANDAKAVIKNDSSGFYDRLSRGQLTGKDIDHLKDLTDESKKIIEDFGITQDDLEQYINQYNEALKLVPEGLEDFTKDLEPEQIKKFVENIENVPSIKNLLVEQFAGLNEEEKQLFGSIVSTIADWSDAKQLSYFAEQLSDYGIMEYDAAQNFIASLGLITNAIIKSTPTDEQIEQAQKLAQAAQSKDQTIDKETYELLGSPTEGFERTLDGNYRWLHTPEEFSALIGDKLRSMVYAIDDETLARTLEGIAAESPEGQKWIDMMTTILATGSNYDLEAAMGRTPIEQAAAQSVQRSRFDEYGMNKTARERAAGGSGEILGVFEEANRRGLDTDALTTYAEVLRKTEGSLKGNADMAYQLALRNTILNEGVKKVADGFNDWNGILWDTKGNLDKVDKSTPEYAAALTEVKGALEDILGFEVDDKFLAENSDKILGAVRQLATAKSEEEAQTYIENIKEIFNQEDIWIKLGIDKTTFNAEYGELQNWIKQQEDAGTLDIEAGTAINTGPFIEGLNAMIGGSSEAATKIQRLFESMGYRVNISQETKKLRLPVIGSKNTAGRQQHEDVMEVLHGKPDLSQATETVQVPKIDMVSKDKPKIDDTTVSGLKDNGTGKSGKTGGSSSSSKKSIWKNPYDELYNLVEKVNEALRDREKLEREYDRILKDRTASVDALHKNSLDEIANLRREIDLQEQLLAGRRRQLANLGQEKIEDENGNLRTLASYGVEKYASYNESTGLITIDWEGIDKIRDTQVGAAVEQYISRIEELSGNIEEAQDNIEEMKDLIQEIKERNMSEYLEFEDRIYQALVDQQQKIIDSYSELNDTINDTNDRILNSLRESIDMERQIRDNTEKEQDIADMENRLAYLRRDTSGANALEIKKLEENLEKARQDQSDTLIDQAIDKLAQDNDKAAEQRAQQIEIMQAQLDQQTKSGAFWEEVETLLADAWADPEGGFEVNKKLTKLLQESDAFKGMSYFGKENWINEMAQTWLQAQEGRQNFEIQDAENKAKENQSTSSTITPTTASTSTATTPTKEYTLEEVKKGVAAAIWKGRYTNGGGWGHGEERVSKLLSVFGSNNQIQSLINQFADGTLSVHGIDTSQFTYSKLRGRTYRTGGIVDFTGPAWLDGTHSKPESVLSARDTANFIQLRDILSDILKKSATNQTNGNTYFDIDINVDEIGSDYDVNQMAEQIKRQIYNDSKYRNINAISFIR